jgi:hypothetical protein
MVPENNIEHYPLVQYPIRFSSVHDNEDLGTYWTTTVGGVACAHIKCD